MCAFRIQEHLSSENTVNLGSYYTPKYIIGLAYQILNKNIPNLHSHIALDTSCGYGAFLDRQIFQKNIGGDVDNYAVEQARIHVNAEIFHTNALINVSRSKYNIGETENLIIIGNPPYNDTTSLAKKHVKIEQSNIDDELKSRDVGISFLISYTFLNPDYICVLHPLSYLIKKTNFSLLKRFRQNYKLIDGIIFSSKEFQNTSIMSQFPIIIALYKKDTAGMDFSYIKNFQFETIENKKFSLNQFDYIENYISKYPSKNLTSEILFWTMRDINALNRNRTFIQKSTNNTIPVPINKLAYYCYVDTLKDHIKHIPYYLGNISIPINNDRFLELKNEFTEYSCKKHPYLQKYIGNTSKTIYADKIEKYFQELLGENYIY